MSNTNEQILREKIRSILRESFLNEDLAVGYDEIDNLEKTLKPQEYVWFDDRTGNLTGEKVTRKEYLQKMLQYAIEKKRWDKVNAALLFLDVNF
jgi:hypothetical protein